MNYETARAFADSWGLLFTVLLFLGLVGWTFRKGASRDHDAAANMIFRDDRSWIAPSQRRCPPDSAMLYWLGN